MDRTPSSCTPSGRSKHYATRERSMRRGGGWVGWVYVAMGKRNWYRGGTRRVALWQGKAAGNDRQKPAAFALGEWVISKFNGTLTPKGSYSAKTCVNWMLWSNECKVQDKTSSHILKKSPAMNKVMPTMVRGQLKSLANLLKLKVIPLSATLGTRRGCSVGWAPGKMAQAPRHLL